MNANMTIKSYRVYTEKGNTVVTATSKAAAQRAIGVKAWKIEEVTPVSESLPADKLDPTH